MQRMTEQGTNQTGVEEGARAALPEYLAELSSDLRNFITDLNKTQLKSTLNSSDLDLLQSKVHFLKTNIEHQLLTGSCTRMREEAINAILADHDDVHVLPFSMDEKFGHVGLLVEQKGERYLFDPSFHQFSFINDEIFKSHHRLKIEKGATLEDLPGKILSENADTKSWHAELLEKGFIKFDDTVARGYLNAFGHPDAEQGMKGFAYDKGFDFGQEPLAQERVIKLDAPSNSNTHPSQVEASKPGSLAGSFNEASGHKFGRGMGVAMGAYGLYEQYKPGGSAEVDFKNEQTKGLAAAGTVANVGAVAADATEMGAAAAVARNAKLVSRVAEAGDDLARLSKASAALSGASKAARVAPIASVTLTVAAGAVEGTIGVKTGDGARTARAVGTTAGGMAGAAAGGWAGAQGGAVVGAAIGVWFGGVGAVPGAAIGGFIGGVGGAIVGGIAGANLGGKATEKLGGSALQAKFDEKLQPALAGVNKEAGLVQKLDRNNDHKIDAKELRQFLNANGKTNHAQLDANQDGKVSSAELAGTLNKEIAEGRREIASQRKGMDNLSDKQLREMIKADGNVPDTINIKGKEIDIREAMKDQELVAQYANSFAKKHCSGEHDFSRTAAMFQELHERQAGQQHATVVGPKVALQHAM